MHATDFLKTPPDLSAVPMLALFGSERYLKVQVLNTIPGFSESEDEDVSLTRVAGKDTDLRAISDELSTISMFGGRRIVLIDSADDFVSQNRNGLEVYAAKAAASSLLILDVSKWAKNTRLYKLFEQHGLNVECGELKGAALEKWLVGRCKQDFGKELSRQSAALIVQLAGDSLGLLNQEIDKLAALVGDSDKITEDDVVKVVGGWRIETTWKMLDAVRDGDVGRALDYLDRLLTSGDPPQKILGGVTYTFRNFAIATEKARQTRELNAALRSSGIHPSAIGPAETYLKRIGFKNASSIFQWLIEADSGMKGGSRIDPRLQLEHLLIKLSGVK